MEKSGDFQARILKQIEFALEDPNPNIRFIGLETLQLFPETTQGRMVLPLVEDSDRFVRWKAVQVLGLLGVKVAESVLALLLDSPDINTRFHVVSSLCKLGAVKYLPQLLQVVEKETSPRVRQVFIKSLTFFPKQEIPWDFLGRSALDTDLGVRLDISVLLGKLAPDKQASDILVNLLERESNNHVFATALISLGRFRNPMLLGYFQHSLLHKESRIRANAIEAMGEFPFEEVEPVISPYLRDPSNRVKANVLAIYYRGGEGGRVEAEVRKLLASPNPWERASAAWLAGQFRLGNFQTELLGLLEDEEAVVSDRAAWAFIRNPLPGTFDQLHKAYSRANQWGLSNLLKAMAGVAEEKDLPKIIALLQKERNPQSKAQMIDLLAKIGAASARPMILPLRKDPDFRIRSSAFNFLAQIQGLDSCPILNEGLSDSQVKVRALCAEWMMKLGDFRALKTLSALLNDADKMQRIQAAYTLKEVATIEAGSSQRKHAQNERIPG